MYVLHESAFAKPFLQCKSSITSSVCVCGGRGVLGYPACKAHAPYYIVIRGPSGSIISLLCKRHDFRVSGGLLNIKCAIWFSLKLSFETLLILRRIQLDIINVHRSSRKVPTRYSWRILTKLELPSQIFETSSNIRFHQNPSSEAELLHADWRTDRQTWRS